MTTDDKEHYPDPTDRASLESNRNAELRIRDRERKLLVKIDEALRRITEADTGCASRAASRSASSGSRSGP